ncbi:hypothetical protein EYF80_032042 [Liparis tanakae]|uniref:Uncharacterized protein n=1 Tax=Liparis tanakae TaxID=230148 RepID=A0A4Z2GYS9_9TELE|nr:hypothetical protein EYF80_032042 [Liparis tanakae]
MSHSSEGSLSRGGSSDRDLKMATSSNTSLDGGPPLHQNRIRQVGVRPSASPQHPLSCNGLARNIITGNFEDSVGVFGESLVVKKEHRQKAFGERT